ncbi:NAD(+)/NADH kinase [Candidatus Daviesbacteria bacterium]|nr:NAD(+)/NADH kinase [Candidatus Daviesbacteria bacterium]
MKVLLLGKNSKNITPFVVSLGFEIVTSNPDVVISYGGDGTLLASERQYPSVPKLPVRNSDICVKCPKHDEQLLLKKLLEGKLKLKEYRKLETTILYQTLYALNDFVVRNINPIHAIRFYVTPSVSSPDLIGGSINNKLLIGDGIVVSTPFGSTGYFKSITQKTFDKGFGVAFNNTTEEVSPIYLKENETINFKLARGTATLSFDNNPDIFNIDEGSELQFKLSDRVAKIYELESLRCSDCKVTRI